VRPASRRPDSTERYIESNLERETLMKIKRLPILAVACAAWLVTGCVDLDIVSNQTSPTAQQVLSEPEELQLVVGGLWPGFTWRHLQDNASATYGMGALGLEWTSGNSTLEHYALPEPRTQTPYPNDYALSNRFLAQNPWYHIYEGIDNANQALILLEQKGMRLKLWDAGEQDDTGAEEPTDKTDRARAFAYYNMGVLYGIFALTYDQASVSLPNTDRRQANWWHHRPYTDIAQVAIDQLKKSIEIAQSSAPFTFPETWMGGNVVDNQQLIRMAHTHIARIMAYLPRTPEERRDKSQGGIVDWQAVVNHANQGIQEPFIVTVSSGGLTSTFVRYHRSTTIQRADQRAYGPADVSGGYEQWINSPIEDRQAFEVITPDRRITGAAGPRAIGKYFRFSTANIPASWAPYQRGHYWFYRSDMEWLNGPKVHLSVSELNLLKAEAHIRRGQSEQALPLINITRVANGELPPMTSTTGVPGDINSCVPRSYDGRTCGSLLDALHYERMIELFGQNNYRSWWDRRGFGTLSEGTFTQLPVPVRELQSLGMPFYTFGGHQSYAADGVLKVR
jgi:hypothetical protein